MSDASSDLDIILGVVLLMDVLKIIKSDKVKMLDRYGFQQKEIAGLLRITPRNVSAHLSNIRKKVQKALKSKTTKTSKLDDQQAT